MEPATNARPRWSWSAVTGMKEPVSGAEDVAAFTSGREQDASSSTQRPQTQQQEQQEQQNARPRQRHYRPRVCRICLEVVQPTTSEADFSETLPAMFTRRTSRVRVKYVSEDPSLGRLITPCKCKGSQKYVHEGCLRAWREAAPLSDRNFWQCPTCRFRYRMERLRWSRWLSSRVTRAVLTLLVMVFSIFLLGFVADPILNLYADPLGSIADSILEAVDEYDDVRVQDVLPRPATWTAHFIDGFVTLGILGFFKTLLSAPFQLISITRGTRRRAGGGRDRLDYMSLYYILIGVIAFLGATWKFVSYLSARALERASDRIVEVQDDNGNDEDDEDADVPIPGQE